jgi:hypothetical protein
MHEDQLRRATYLKEAQSASGQQGGLLDLLRRIVAPRPAQILVMDRDGQLHCAAHHRSTDAPRFDQ